MATEAVIPSSYYVSVTVINKISDSNDYPQFTLKCSATDLIKSLRLQIHDQLKKSVSEYQIHIAFKGKLLNDTSTLQSYDLIPKTHQQTPKIYVTMRKLEAKIIKSKTTRQQENEQKAKENEQKTNEWHIVESNAANDSNEQSAEITEEPSVPSVPASNDIIDIQHQQIIDNEEDHKQCRLCFSSEEDNPSLGQLFQPCRCRGTMKWIHVKCLNEWRAVAPNARSYYRCDQCHYEYNLRRAEWADMVAHPNTSKAISAIVLFIGVILFGVLTFWLPFAEYIYQMIEWHPIQYFAHKICTNGSKECESLCNSWFPWNECPRRCFPCYYEPMNEWNQMYIEMFFSGVFVLSVLGLTVQRDMIWRHKWMFIMTLMQSTRVWRLYLLAGIGHSFYTMLNIVTVVVKKFLFQFGEKILAIHQE